MEQQSSSARQNCIEFFSHSLRMSFAGMPKKQRMSEQNNTQTSIAALHFNGAKYCTEMKSTMWNIFFVPSIFLSRTLFLRRFSSCHRSSRERYSFSVFIIQTESYCNRINCKGIKKKNRVNTTKRQKTIFFFCVRSFRRLNGISTRIFSSESKIELSWTSAGDGRTRRNVLSIAFEQIISVLCETIFGFTVLLWRLSSTKLANETKSDDFRCARKA